MTNDFMIRADFKDVEGDIFKLYSIGLYFEKNDQKWSHLKHKEDYKAIYELSQNDAFEKIYEKGRNSAYKFGCLLISVNENIPSYQTLTSTIYEMRQEFNSEKINECKMILQNSIDTLSYGNIQNYALRTMNELFEDQIELMETVCGIIQMLENSDLYKKENPLLINSIASSDNAPEHIKNFIWYLNAVKKRPFISMAAGVFLVLLLGSNWIYENNKHFINVKILHKEIDNIEKIKVEHIFCAGKQCKSLVDDIHIKTNTEPNGLKSELKRHFTALGFDDSNLLNYDNIDVVNRFNAYSTAISKFEGFIDGKYPNYRSLYNAGFDLILSIKTKDKEYLLKFDKDWKNYQANVNYVTPNFDIGSVRSENDVVVRSVEILEEIKEWTKN